MVSYVRVDGQSFQILGSCSPPPVTKPGPTKDFPGHDLAPGKCDVANFKGFSAAACNEACYTNPACSAYVLNTKEAKQVCWLKSCSEPMVPSSTSDAHVRPPPLTHTPHTRRTHAAHAAHTPHTPARPPHAAARH